MGLNRVKKFFLGPNEAKRKIIGTKLLLKGTSECHERILYLIFLPIEIIDKSPPATWFQVLLYLSLQMQFPGMRPATLLKKRLWHRCFPVNFAKFLRTPFFIEHLWWLLLVVTRSSTK